MFDSSSENELNSESDNPNMQSILIQQLCSISKAKNNKRGQKQS